jgi:hypothetical protein
MLLEDLAVGAPGAHLIQMRRVESRRDRHVDLRPKLRLDGIRRRVALNALHVRPEAPIGSARPVEAGGWAIGRH